METPEQLAAYFHAALAHTKEMEGHGFITSIAEYLGVDRSLMGKYCTGARKVPPKLQREIADACGFEYTDFLKWGQSLLTAEDAEGKLDI